MSTHFQASPEQLSRIASVAVAASAKFVRMDYANSRLADFEPGDIVYQLHYDNGTWGGWVRLRESGEIADYPAHVLARG